MTTASVDSVLFLTVPGFLVVWYLKCDLFQLGGKKFAETVNADQMLDGLTFLTVCDFYLCGQAHFH